METISILGCGWLGLPLAEYLIKCGYKVKGSTRTKKEITVLESKGIESYLLVLDPNIRGDNLDSFFKSDVLIINFPPERRDDIVQYHRLQAVSLMQRVKLSSIEKVVFVSSTSVYPDLNRIVSEEETQAPSKSSGKALLEVEKLLNNCDEFKTTVLRFAGLIGYDRKPGRFLAGKRELKNGEAPVNLIHRDDCINIIHQIIEKDIWVETFNACMDVHPKRKDYYIHEANKMGLAPPTFTKSEKCSYKIVSSEKLKKRLDYSYEYPDPLQIDDD
jgi:nucleoside-diphosphate-sugar epimerase